MNITKEQLSKIINDRFPRIANYLKTQTKTQKSNIILSITYLLHKVYLNKITDLNNANYILDYIESHYIKKYINKTDIKIDVLSIKKLNEKLSKKYVTESDILALDEQNLLLILSEFEENVQLDNLKQNVLKTYNIIQKEYKNIQKIN